MDKESFDKLVDAIEEAGFEARKYSGRCMYGRNCLGVYCDSPISCVMQIVSSACENEDDVDSVKELVDAISCPSEDAMGREAVVYWPSIPWLEDEEEDGGDGDHGVEVSTEEYEEEHGRKPRGEGGWYFFPDGVDDLNRAIRLNGDYKECRAKACKVANEQGVELLVVGT